jgi:hypothetical protein
MQVTELKGRFQNQRREAIYYPDELSFLVKNKEATDEIIDYNLRNSNDIGNNEQLIRFIALEDEKLFRKLQRNMNQYKLEDISFLKLPNDINIKYAMDNFSDIFCKSSVCSHANCNIWVCITSSILLILLSKEMIFKFISSILFTK